MIIKCKKSKRFLCEIDIENYLKHLKDIGISLELPLRIVIPCRSCKKIEVYNVYSSHYVFDSNIIDKK